MILLFGQLPQGAYVDRQFTLHALVGSVGDIVPEPPKPPAILGGGNRKHSPTYIRRDSITPTPPTADDDLLAALAVLTLLQIDQNI